MRVLAGIVACAALLATGCSADSRAAGGVAPLGGAAPCADGAESCTPRGAVRWSVPLPGDYVVPDDRRGTVATEAEPAVAVGDDLVLVGRGTEVNAYDARRGTRRWRVALTGLPDNPLIVSVRVWPGIVTAGVAYGRPERTGRIAVVLDARTGRQLHSHPSAAHGGTVYADGQRVVVVSTGAVTAYDPATGERLWSRATRSTGDRLDAQQAWRVDGRTLYVTVDRDGFLGTAPAGALRRIDLRTGRQALVRTSGGGFPGGLAYAAAGVVLFEGPVGVSVYDGRTGQALWTRAGSVLHGCDLPAATCYVARNARLVGVEARTGRDAVELDAAGVYGIQAGVALRLRGGAKGEASGVEVASGRELWRSGPLPWLHYYVDLGRIGGSEDPRRPVLALAACAHWTEAATPDQGRPCVKPLLVVVNR